MTDLLQKRFKISRIAGSKKMIVIHRVRNRKLKFDFLYRSTILSAFSACMLTLFSSFDKSNVF